MPDQKELHGCSSPYVVNDPGAGQATLVPQISSAPARFVPANQSSQSRNSPTRRVSSPRTGCQVKQLGRSALAPNRLNVHAALNADGGPGHPALVRRRRAICTTRRVPYCRWSTSLSAMPVYLPGVRASRRASASAERPRPWTNSCIRAPSTRWPRVRSLRRS